MAMPATNGEILVPPSVRFTACHAGDAFNVIASEVTLRGTVRAFKSDVRAQCEERLISIATSVAAAFGGVTDIDYQKGYPATSNHADQADFWRQIATLLVGPENVRSDFPPIMGAEDFSFMLQAVPDAFIFFGNGPSANLHSPAYDFNDDAVVLAIEFWIKLLKRSAFQAETRRD